MSLEGRDTLNWEIGLEHIKDVADAEIEHLKRFYDRHPTIERYS